MSALPSLRPCPRPSVRTKKRCSPVPGDLTHGSLGVRFDSATGLHYMRQRWYDSSTQRFISRDQLLGVNRYAYAISRPVNYVDTDGLKAILSETLIRLCRDRDLPQKWERARRMAIERVRRMRDDCSCWPQDIDYLRYLDGDWDVTFTAAPPDKMDDLEEGGWPWETQEPWKHGGRYLVYGTETACPGNREVDLNTLSDQILHEITHAGTMRNFSRDWDSPSKVGPLDESAHPTRYFRDGIDRCR